MKGFVYLVGAGPGDPRLLTVRALELIESAEVVAHDELISGAILALVPPTAEMLPVGRRAGQGPASYALHPAVLERAHAGRVVVRLKSGDPLIFGRGGEEAEKLAEEGIPFEIVPGVSSALGAAAYAGIPLTHRLHASGVAFRTGHAAHADALHADTIVVYMSARRLEENLAQLIANGRPPSTPAACIVAATTPEQRVIVGTLADLASRMASQDGGAPTLLIVGDVVALRKRIAWIEHRPLFGRRLLVARARPGRSEIAARLRTLGAEVIEAPIVETAPIENIAPLLAALARLEKFHAVVFGCAGGVDSVHSAGGVRQARVVAVGDEAARALARHGIQPAVELQGACRDALGHQVSFLRGGSLLVITSQGGRPSLVADLAALGAQAETVAAYRYTSRMPRLSLAPIDLVVLPSSSAARSVLSSELGPRLRHLPMVAIGPRTEESARNEGAEHVVRPQNDSIEGLVERVIARLAGTTELHPQADDRLAEAREPLS